MRRRGTDGVHAGLQRRGRGAELFYDSIEGFDYSEGTSYVIDVQVVEVASPPADGSSLSYSLVEVVSETPGQ